MDDPSSSVALNENVEQTTPPISALNIPANNNVPTRAEKMVAPDAQAATSEMNNIPESNLVQSNEAQQAEPIPPSIADNEYRPVPDESTQQELYDYAAPPDAQYPSSEFDSSSVSDNYIQPNDGIDSSSETENSTIVDSE